MHTDDDATPSRSSDNSYRSRASSLHERAGEARTAEGRRDMQKIARCYEVLARHVERRRAPDKA